MICPSVLRAIVLRAVATGWLVLLAAGIGALSGTYAVAGESGDATATASTVAGIPYMLDARVVGDESRVRFVADMSETVTPEVFTLANPYRIVVDLPEVRFALPDGAGESGRGLVSAFRYGLISKGKSRVVIDVTGPVAVDKQFSVDAVDGQPARLVIDVVPATVDQFAATAKAYRLAHAVTEDTTVETPEPSADARPLIVLDPGHGGIDYGTHGIAGTQEKDVVLAFAKVLGGQLLATQHYRVVYTRNDDSFITLSQRVEIARNQHADLFVSIHANSFSESAIRGATIYTVSDRASDKMAAALADSENQSDALAGIDVTGEDSDEVKDILVDLTRRETRNFGVVFAQNLVKNLGKSIKMFKVPHQEAGFRVLEAPDVPSALIELGYLTNADDEKLMVARDWQEKTAGSIVEAINGYFSTHTANR
jgi:N-acetylmuramoyl-L-alanine amidase